MVELSDVLWKVRKRVERDIARAGLERRTVMATLVWLLDRTLIRVGSHELAKENDSFGLTTLRRRHVSIDGATLRFEFRGKSGVAHTVAVTDRRIAGIVQRCRELPGRELFQYVDARGRRQIVYADDVNTYLREMGPAATQRQAKHNVLCAIDRTAERLGNTRAVCRKYYIHPALIEAYLEDEVLPPLGQRVWQERRPHGPTLRRHEAEVLAFLKARV
jgi:DNA topoisomerase-1